MSIPAAGIRLSSQELGNELGHRLTATADAVVVGVKLPTEATGAADECDGGTEARLGWDTSALNCCSLVGGPGGEWRRRKTRKREHESKEMQIKGDVEGEKSRIRS